MRKGQNENDAIISAVHRKLSRSYQERLAVYNLMNIFWTFLFAPVSLTQDKTKKNLTAVNYHRGSLPLCAYATFSATTVQTFPAVLVNYFLVVFIAFLGQLRYCYISSRSWISICIRVMLWLFQFWSLGLLRLGFWLCFSLMVTDMISPLIWINHVGFINSCLEFEISILSEVLVISVSFAI